MLTVTVYQGKNKNMFGILIFLEIKKKRNLKNFEFYIDHCTHKSKIILPILGT